jgi:ssDNA-binding Zn-finger/Zn-ribbon topoisomerase 1
MKLSIEQLKGLIKDSRIDLRGQNVVGLCPKCGHDEFGVSIENNHRFGCYRKKQCGYTGNIFTLLKDLGKLQDFKETDGYVRTNKDTLEKKIQDIVEEIEEQEEVTLPFGFRRIYQHWYLDQRGFTELDYTKYKVGTTSLDTKFHNYIIFPVEVKEKIVGYVGRTTKTKSEIKELNDEYKRAGLKKKAYRYINSKTNFGNLVYGLEEITDETVEVVVVEGIFDKCNVDRKLELGLGDLGERPDEKVSEHPAVLRDLGVERLRREQRVHRALDLRRRRVRGPRAPRST